MVDFKLFKNLIKTPFAKFQLVKINHNLNVIIFMMLGAKLIIEPL